MKKQLNGRYMLNQILESFVETGDARNLEINKFHKRDKTKCCHNVQLLLLGFDVRAKTMFDVKVKTD